MTVIDSRRGSDQYVVVEPDPPDGCWLAVVVRGERLGVELGPEQLTELIEALQRWKS